VAALVRWAGTGKLHGSGLNEALRGPALLADFHRAGMARYRLPERERNGVDAHADDPVIRCLIPDLPEASALVPWLVRIDANRWYTNSGPLVREFEQRLLEFLDGMLTANCVAVSSGMSALELGLQALEIGAGKRVLMPALTFPATALAVMRRGASPVFGDVCPRRWSMTPAIAQDVLEREHIDLVMPVATFGLPLPSDDWDDFIARTQVPVLADAAAALGVQALASRVHWVFSLHATKPMGIGEGGLFVSPDAALTERVRRLANFGFEAGAVAVGGGSNAKLSEYAAAVGLAQLQRWPWLSERRRTVLRDYRHHIESLPEVRMQEGLNVPPATLCVQLPGNVPVIAARLAREGIETRRWYLPPLYEHPAFGGVQAHGFGGGDALPVTARLAGSLLGLPFHTRLSAEDTATVVRSLAVVLAGLSADRASSGEISA
jgi:dTDP-4-amino-4,6-dideoxygalactose transaminase